ncbi:MAG: FprA family A-type flavoprotein [Clostridium sp.]|nr:FprA family A-type flavoprotein [Clostridium sp.]
MSNTVTISDSILYVGVADTDIDLFESQYPVPQGVTYNSYVIADKKVAVMDTVDARKTEEWLQNLEQVLNGRTPDYLVISHLEPDHSGSIEAIVKKYPEMKLVGNAKIFAMLPQFITMDVTERQVVVTEQTTLNLGSHILHFVFAPMVHWPEVMVEYEETEKVLFSADAFGRFGDSDAGTDWDNEARRYYINIVGKYGGPVTTLLKKAAGLDIRTICPLHGPVLTGDLSHYIEKYQTWASYQPEEKGILIAYASIHGNTEIAAKKMASILEEKGAENVVLYDLARADVAAVVADAFRYDRMILAAASYDAGVFPCMETFLNHLKAKAYQKRTVGLIENGSWAPSAGRVMKKALEECKEIEIVEPIVTIKSTLKTENLPQLSALADAILNK